MAQVKREDMRIGHWWAPCCLHDLQQVQDEEDIATIMDDEMLMFCGGWDTCAEAVDDLIQECDQDERLFLLRWYRGGGANQAIAHELARYVADGA